MPGPWTTFGGSSVAPGQVAYASFSLTASLDLEWPGFSSAGSDVYACIMDITADNTGYSITFADATQVGTGTTALFRNTGSNTVTIKADDGSTLTTVAAGVAKFMYLQDNSTAAGTWGVVTFGTGTSAADASLLAGYGLQAISTTLNQAHPTRQTAAAITVSATTDLAGVIVATGGSVAATLPASSAAGSSFFCFLKNDGTGTVTITPSGADTVDLAATLDLAPNDAVMLCSLGGSNAWITIGYGRSVTFAFTQLVKSVAGSSDVTLTSAECANKLITLTGALTGNINVKVTNTASVYYVFNNTSGAYTLTVKTAAGTGISVTQSTHDILVCDATNVYRGFTNTAGITAFTAGSAGAPSVTFVGSTTSGLYLPAANVPGMSANGFEVMSWNAPASSVNWMDVYASATGVNPKVVANGTDTNIGFRIQPKGTGKFQITDGTDTTKVVQFACSGITTATIRTVTVPDADFTLMGLTTSGTVQNKTLDDTNTIAVKDTLFTLQDDGDATKLAAFQLSGITTGNTRTITVPDSNTTLPIAGQVITLSGPTAARTYTFPDAAATVAALNVADQTLAGGVIVTSNSLGTISSGTVTPSPGTRPLQHYTNGGAHTLAPSANKGWVIVEVTNNVSAGAITTSGFTKVTGDAFTTTNGNKFILTIIISQTYSLLQVQALQ